MKDKEMTEMLDEYSESQYNKVHVWNVRDGREIISLEGHSDRVFSVAFSPDGKTLASGSLDGTVRLWGIGQ